MEISVTDVRRIRLDLDGAARLYDTQPGRRSACRAWVMRRMIKKLDGKLERQLTGKGKGK